MAEAGEDLQQGLEPDMRFHKSIFAASGNNLLASLVFLIEAAMAQTIEIGCSAPGARMSSIPLHKNVLEAIRQQNPNDARESVRILIEEARADMERVVNQLGNDAA